MLIFFLKGLTFALPPIAAPSPFKLFLLSHALEHGWRRTLPASLAPLVGDIPIIVLVLMVLTQMPDGFLMVIRLIGGFFILYIALRIVRSMRIDQNKLIAEQHTAGGTFFKAIGLIWLNPNPYIFWSLIGGPVFLEGYAQSPWAGAGFIAGFYIVWISALTTLTIIFDRVGRISPKINKGIGVVATVGLVVFGVYQIWTGAAQVLAHYVS